VSLLSDALDLPAGPRSQASTPDPSASIEGPFPSDAPYSLPASRPTAREAGGEAPTRLSVTAFDPGRRGLKALAAVTVAVIAVAGLVMWYARPHLEPVAGPAILPPADGVAVASSSLIVAVAGRVRRPGLVELPVGARVADAIEAAGGALPGTDLSFVNLARKVSDGELIVVGMTAPAGGGPGAAGGGLINLNTATLAQLDTLPGVGPVLAQRILDYRTKHGGFRTVAELRQVDGVGDARYEQLKSLVTV
jgi:competence protein ComEA